jgi:hypothetical protein
MTLDEFDAFLGEDVHPVHWEAVGVDEARDMASRLTEADWKSLQIIWSGRPRKWQQRFAGSLSLSNPHYAIPLLKEMILSSDDQLALVAAVIIQSVGEGNACLDLSPQIITRLRYLSNTYPEIETLNIKDLLSKIDCKR